MKQVCRHCTAEFEILDEERAFLERISWTYGTVKIHPPLPVLCPTCRMLARTCHRNERFLYKTTSAFSGKEIISIFASEPLWGEPYKVYAEDEWNSDHWDPMEYGRGFDFTRPFFDQFADLTKAVPRTAVTTVSNENSGFTTGTGYCRNCYLINSSEYCEDCYYGKLLQTCKDSIDCSYLYDSEHCYGCFSAYNCYNCQNVSFSQNCSDCFFSSNLKSCTNCCLCTNLDRKEYCFQNEQLSKEEYEKRLQYFRGAYGPWQEMKKALRGRSGKMIRKYANIVNGQNCTGDYIENSKNCIDCYDMNGSEDCRYVQVGVKAKDLYDCSNMYINPELCYETIGTIEVFNCAYSIYVFHSQNLLYCDYCYNCSDCFGCSGLRRKKHCIFNKQYSKEQYDAYVLKIIEKMKKDGEYGLFFPARFSPFGYNESLAGEYIPRSEEEVRKRGWLWRPKDVRDYRPQTCEPPENIDAATDALTQEILACETCRKNYRIIPQELIFYHRHKIPVPHRCPDCRHEERMQLRNPRKLWKRECAKCENEMETTYSPERPEKVYCEECYLKEVY